MLFTRISLVVLVAATAGLTACSGDVKKADANPTPHGMKEGPGIFSGKTGNMLDAFNKDENTQGGSKLSVNAFLWRASLETLSFLPLTQADGVSGVILSDWYQAPENANEQVKVNVYILGTRLTPQSLRAEVFKRVKRGDKWVDVPADRDTAPQLEETILTRARELRVKEMAAE